MKARQKGISKIIDADITIECIKKPTKAIIISHEQDSTKRLFASVKGFTETMRYRPTISIDSTKEIGFPRRGSSFFIGTAGQKAIGRGDTIDRAHLSEAAFYPDLERILNGVEEACEFGQIDIETTPNGRDKVYDMVQKAKSGMSSYTFIFIPWFIDGEYSVENLTQKEKEGLSTSVQAMINISEKDFIFTHEEKKLIERVKREWDIDLTIGMIKWRRYKIWDKGQMFYQEYPEDDVSCFLQSGRTVFASITTDQNKKIDLADFDEWAKRKGMKEIEKNKILNKRYFAGMDCAEGTLTGDAHCFSVIDIDMQTGKGIVIFEMTSNEPVDVFDTKVMRICERFNITLGVEKNGVGVAHVLKLRELGVILNEWETTGASRPVMVTELEEAYRKEDLIETYPEAENEARDMEYTENNRAEHKNGKHDDRVFSRAIAWQMRKEEIAGLQRLEDLD